MYHFSLPEFWETRSLLCLQPARLPKRPRRGTTQLQSATDFSSPVASPAITMSAGIKPCAWIFAASIYLFYVATA
jgi:hypothetical protein